jgi:hypothetical protein
MAAEMQILMQEGVRLFESFRSVRQNERQEKDVFRSHRTAISDGHKKDNTRRCLQKNHRSRIRFEHGKHFLSFNDMKDKSNKSNDSGN